MLSLKAVCAHQLCVYLLTILQLNCAPIDKTRQVTANHFARTIRHDVCEKPQQMRYNVGCIDQVLQPFQYQ